LLPMPEVLFSRLRYEAGSDAAARVVFQMLVTDLVSVRHPTANEVAGPGGTDWGIDTYVGRLDDSVVVWQSKFFLDWKGEDQRNQVRDSFNSLLENAVQEGFQVSAWTLCVPCILPPLEQKWFDGWAARMRRKHNIARIELWNGVELRRQLIKSDAEDVKNQYFPETMSRLPSEPVATERDLHEMATALFVRQLEEAGYIETDAARGLFFAAEALARDLATRGNPAGTAALQELHLEIQALWEAHFNSALPGADNNGRMAGLIDCVLQGAANCGDPEGLRLRPAHRKGVAHRLVENARAGWVRHWRAIAEAHDGVAAADIVIAKLSSSKLGNAP
jgi:hypothetical protein